MNLVEIFKMQKKLDESIMNEHKVEKEEIRLKRIVALIVEVGEFANEYAPFKYWKKNKKINRDLVIEEFVDGIHFLSSLAIELDLSPIIEPKIISENLTDQLATTFKLITKLIDVFDKNILQEAFATYLGNSKLLNISEKDISEHYIKKNKINYDRLTNNY